MLNHARTLLMNVDGTSVPSFIYPGDEAIDPEYKALILPDYVNAIRAQLFGVSPDRVMLNFRCKQLLAVIQASPLIEYILNLDTRITYSLDNTSLINTSSFMPSIYQMSGVPDDQIAILNKPEAPDTLGRTRHSFVIDILGGISIRVARVTPPIQNVLFDFVPGAVNPLPGSGYSFRLSTSNINQSWRVDIYNRPQVNLGQLIANLQVVGAPVLDSLFGLTQDEPYLTFRNLWFTAPETVLKLSGIIMATVYRSEERRLGLT